MAEALGLGVTAWSPLAGGVLTGKYAEGKAESEARMNSEMMKAFRPGRRACQAVVAEVQAVAREVGRSPAQVALAWLRQRPVPVIPIVGARRLEQFRDNLACLDLQLDESQVGTARCGEPGRAGLPARLLRQRHGEGPGLRRDAGQDRRVRARRARRLRDLIMIRLFAQRSLGPSALAYSPGTKSGTMHWISPRSISSVSICASRQRPVDGGKPLRSDLSTGKSPSARGPAGGR